MLSSLLRNRPSFRTWTLCCTLGAFLAATTLPFGPFVRDAGNFRAGVVLRSRSPWPSTVPCGRCHRVPSADAAATHCVGVCGNGHFQSRHSAVCVVVGQAAKQFGLRVEGEAPLQPVPGLATRLRVDLLLEDSNGVRTAVDPTCSLSRPGQSLEDAERVAFETKLQTYGAACVLSRCKLQPLFFNAPLCVPGPKTEAFLETFLAGSKFGPRSSKPSKFWSRRVICALLASEERALLELLS